MADSAFQPGAPAGLQTTPGGPATTTTTSQPVAPTAPAAPASSGASSMLMLVLPLVLVAFMFMMTRGQTKKQKELESKLKVGDRVQTRAGFIVKLVEVSERTVKVELAPGVKVIMVKSAVEGLAADENAPALATDEKRK